MMWIYRVIIVPRLTYAAVAWSAPTSLNTVCVMLASEQVLFLKSNCPVKTSTPSTIIGALLDVSSLAVEIEAAAMRTAYKLCIGEWKNSSIHRKLMRDCTVKLCNSPQDRIRIRLRMHVIR